MFCLRNKSLWSIRRLQYKQTLFHKTLILNILRVIRTAWIQRNRTGRCTSWRAWRIGIAGTGISMERRRRQRIRPALTLWKRKSELLMIPHKTTFTIAKNKQGTWRQTNWQARQAIQVYQQLLTNKTKILMTPESGAHVTYQRKNKETQIRNCAPEINQETAEQKANSNTNQ